MLGLPLAVTIPVALVVATMGVAMVVVILGHLTGIRSVLATGLLLLTLATAGMLVGGFGSWRDSPGPAADPLRGDDRQLPAPGETIGEARARQKQQRQQQRDAQR